MKKKLIIGAIILVAIGILITANFVKSKGTGAFSRDKAVEVRVVDAKIQDIDSTINANGVFEEVDTQDIYFDFSVRVNKVLVTKNQQVKKGERLAELDLSDYYSQLDQSRVSLNIQKINLEKLKNSINHQDMTRVKSEVEQTRKAKEQAEKNYQKLKQLFEAGAISQVELDNARVQYENTVLQYNTAQDVLNEAQKNNSNQLINNAKDIESQREQIKLAELKIDELEQRISKMKQSGIANIDGIISEINIEEGSLTNPAVKSFSIINPNILRVKLEVKEIDVLKVKSGQIAEITGDAFPDKVIKGTVDTIGVIAAKKQSVSSSEQAFVDVTVQVDNSDRFLKPGLSASASIITETRKNVVVIPFNTFHEDKDGNKWAYVIEDNIAHKKDIKIGISSGLDMEITSGLTGNEKLVEDPPSRLKDGMKILVVN